MTETRSGFPGPVVIAGDFNDYGMAASHPPPGLRLAHRMGGATHTIFPMDHILTRGLVSAQPGGVGVVREVQGASDHHPVWAVLVPAPAAALAGAAGS